MPLMIAHVGTKIQNKSSCSLCGQPVNAHSVFMDKQPFCCHGCQLVYQILEAQNQLPQKENHPLLFRAAQMGLISNPNLLKKIETQLTSVSKASQKWVVEIEGMWCPSCAELIFLALTQKKGINRCRVDYITDLASIEFDPLQLSRLKIESWITSLGYKISEIKAPEERPFSYRLTLKFAVAAFCSLNIMMFSYPLYATYFNLDLEGLQPLLAWISCALSLPVVLYSGSSIYQKMWSQLRIGHLALEALVGIGTIAAFLLSLWEIGRGTHQVYFDTISVVIAFLLLGKLMESQAKFSTKSALLHLHQGIPRKGRVRRADGSYEFKPIKEIQIGDELAAFSGERIVLDGLLINGEGSCDESLITGEAKPVSKRAGSSLFSGSIAASGPLYYKVTAQEKGSTLHRILDLISQDLQKSIYIRSIDTIVKWFTPLILFCAFLVFVLITVLIGMDEAVKRSLALILIACPCAVGIAAPLVEANIINRFAKKGALVRNRALLALLPKITHFVFDKTGTITEGRFQVLSGVERLSPTEKAILKALVSVSCHPISCAIAECLSSTPILLTASKEISGKGVAGEYEGQTYTIGSARFARENGINCPDASAQNSCVYFFSNGIILTEIELGDRIKPEAQKMLERLTPFNKILLSGDQKHLVQTMAQNLGFDQWAGEVSPAEKQSFIVSLKQKGALVAMIGDGINDAPALAKADVGISVVRASDLSIQVSDLLLTSDNLNLIVELRELSLKGFRIIKQNFFWAFAYNLVGVILAIGGILTPLFASFAMIMSSLFVLLNSKRV